MGFFYLLYPKSTCKIMTSFKTFISSPDKYSMTWKTAYPLFQPCITTPTQHCTQHSYDTNLPSFTSQVHGHLSKVWKTFLRQLIFYFYVIRLRLCLLCPLWPLYLIYFILPVDKLLQQHPPLWCNRHRVGQQ